MKLFTKKVRPIPDGCSPENIRQRSSICTGESIIGFLHPKTGQLMEAVVCRSKADRDAFYKSYGLQPPADIV